MKVQPLLVPKKTLKMRRCEKCRLSADVGSFEELEIHSRGPKPAFICTILPEFSTGVHRSSVGASVHINADSPVRFWLRLLYKCYRLI
jgi:hypothetical protein